MADKMACANACLASVESTSLGFPDAVVPAAVVMAGGRAVGPGAPTGAGCAVGVAAGVGVVAIGAAWPVAV